MRARRHGVDMYALNVGLVFLTTLYNMNIVSYLNYSWGIQSFVTTTHRWSHANVPNWFQTNIVTLSSWLLEPLDTHRTATLDLPKPLHAPLRVRVHSTRKVKIMLRKMRTAPLHHPVGLLLYGCPQHCPIGSVAPVALLKWFFVVSTHLKLIGRPTHHNASGRLSVRTSRCWTHSNSCQARWLETISLRRNSRWTVAWRQPSHSASSDRRKLWTLEPLRQVQLSSSASSLARWSKSPSANMAWCHRHCLTRPRWLDSKEYRWSWSKNTSLKATSASWPSRC